MALVVLLCGAASADAAVNSSWCSSGFDAPAVLSNGGDGYMLKIGKKTERLGEGRRMGTGMNMSVLPSGDTVMSGEVEQGGETIDIVILRDRVFWPCDE